MFFTSSLVINRVVCITSIASKLNELCRDFSSNIPLYFNLYSLLVINTCTLTSRYQKWDTIMLSTSFNFFSLRLYLSLHAKLIIRKAG